MAVGLLTLSIAGVSARYVTAEGERTFAVGDDPVILWNANAGVAATVACLAPLTTRFTNRASTP
jgi:hypothetical protein